MGWARIFGFLMTAGAALMGSMPTDGRITAFFGIDDALFWLVIVPGVASGIKAGVDIYGRAQEREANKKDAKQQKKLTQYNAETARGSMEKELVQAMGSDYERKQDIEVQRDARSSSDMESTYMGQLRAESQYQDQLASNERALGDLASSQASSGAKADLTVQSIINAEMQQQAAGTRTQIDKGLDLSVYQNRINTDAATTEANRLGGKYGQGSAVMSLYNYRRERITGEETLQTTYLDDVVKDNQYNWKWFTADAFTVGSAALGVAGNAYEKGYFNGGTSNGGWGGGTTSTYTAAKAK